MLRVKNLSVSFGNFIALNEVSFELGRGESLAVIGPNGSGKTVLLKAMLGLVPYGGEIAWHPDARLAYVPQKIDADRHIPISLHDLLKAKADVQGLKPSDVRSASHSVGLGPDVLKTPIGHLSGGQFQKALIAFALLGDPNVLLFDEPTASLDELSEEHVYDLLDDLRRTRGITVVLVSHDISMIPQVATTVLCLNKHAVCYGKPREVLTVKTLDELYTPRHKYYKHASGEDEHGHAARHKNYHPKP